MTNKLKDCSSPYLLQHADNPVHWYPWGEEAWAAARAANKPVLLSVGYSACHWCHVMAHESFEDPATAAVMNELFVNIKVDREERPDIDRIYQLAHQLLTQNGGGWPLTMFLDPNSQHAFYGGTYFPKEARFGLPGFTDLLRRVADSFHEQTEELAGQSEKLSLVLNAMNDASDAVGDDQATLQAARDTLVASFDSRYGGFGQAPKFPNATAVSRLLRHWSYQRAFTRDNDREALEAVMTTLTGMARGGIFDHLGGGWCRYSVDEKWMIPHFEKMLYDNGQLLSLYADALSIGPDALFEGAVRETVGWLDREMRSPEGGLYSALDADSDGEEGTFYVWRRDQVKRLLSEDEYLLIETLYGLDKPANFEGRWNLHRGDSWRSVVDRLSLTAGEAQALLASARGKLFMERSKRTRPGLDDKCLTAWNALAAQGIAKAGAVLAEPTWLDSADASIDFLRQNLWRDGTLHAIWQGSARQEGFLDDYACTLSALMTKLSIRWRGEDLDWAIELADTTLEKFEDVDNGGFFFTAHDAEALMFRPKPTMDEALPAGNGVLASALLALGHLMGEPRYLDSAARTLTWARGTIERYPAGHGSLCGALEELANPSQTVILRGPVELSGQWREAMDGGYSPWRQCYQIPFEERGGALPSYLPRLVSGDTRERVTAYICTGTSCSLPMTDIEEFKAALG